MRWEGRRQSTNIEDLRGQRSGSSRPGGFPGGFPGGSTRVRVPTTGRSIRTGGGGIGTIVVLVVVFLLLRSCGIDPLEMIANQGGGDVFGPGIPQTTQTSPAPSGVTRNDETTQFVATVLAETEDVWDGIFQANGRTYTHPTLVLFDGQVSSACGFASAAAGPFYCPNDQKLYIDLSFYDELARRFHAAGDFAQAYVLAHEVGHHVQNLIGVLPQFNRMRQTMSEADANAMSVRVELQADCFAGVWGHFTAQKGLLEAGDLEEALNAANQIGDDTLQRSMQGYVVPDSFTHGTSAQRRNWFNRGFQSGKMSDCDTFSGKV